MLFSAVQQGFYKRAHRDDKELLKGKGPIQNDPSRVAKKGGHEHCSISADPPIDRNKKISADKAFGRSGRYVMQPSTKGINTKNLVKVTTTTDHKTGEMIYHTSRGTLRPSQVIRVNNLLYKRPVSGDWL